MMDKISMSMEFLDEMLAHCKEAYPFEACGLLAGEEETVRKIYKIKNIQKSRVNYEMESGEQFRCEKDIKGTGLKVIGIYHSHPSSPAYPSHNDIAGVNWPGDSDNPIYPGACYIIIGPIDSEIEVRAFTIGPGRKINEIDLNIA